MAHAHNLDRATRRARNVGILAWSRSRAPAWPGLAGRHSGHPRTQIGQRPGGSLQGTTGPVGPDHSPARQCLRCVRGRGDDPGFRRKFSDCRVGTRCKPRSHCPAAVPNGPAGFQAGQGGAGGWAAARVGHRYRHEQVRHPGHARAKEDQQEGFLGAVGRSDPNPHAHRVAETQRRATATDSISDEQRRPAAGIRQARLLESCEPPGRNPGRPGTVDRYLFQGRNRQVPAGTGIHQGHPSQQRIS